MKLIRTKGRAAQQTAEILAALEDRGGAALDAVLPAVKRIVADVRKQGDRALLRYAAQFDGLAGADALEGPLEFGEVPAGDEDVEITVIADDHGEGGGGSAAPVGGESGIAEDEADAVAYFSQGYNCAQACCSLTDPVSALMPTTA